MKNLVALLVIAGLFVGLAIAAEEGVKEARKVTKQDVMPSEKAPQSRADVPAAMRKGTFDPKERQQQMLAKLSDTHKQAIDELEEIKKIAQEEGATRTVEALQKMIDKKNDEYKKRIGDFTRMQHERAKQIRDRMEKSDVKESKAEQIKKEISPREPVE